MATIIPVTPAPIPRAFATENDESAASCESTIETIAVDANVPTACLLHTFTVRKKRFRVFYNAGKLIWERHPSKKDRCTVSVDNIIAINPQYGGVTNPAMTNEVKTNDEIGANEPVAKPEVKQFTIVYAKRIENSSNPNKWRHSSITFQNNDPQVCQQWIETLQQHIDEQISRPKRLLLFVNPYGGKKRALQIYDGAVKPIFQLAGIDASVVISQRSNQIRDFIMTQSLEHFDGIVCIGGDGTFSEVFNGIIFRTIKDLGLSDVKNLSEVPKVQKPIGIIPAGSTDTVAFCLNGTCDIRTTVLNIVLGQVNGLDLSSVSNQNGLLKFYASVMSYGFLGDVAIESEKFRWMGPKRYDYSGFKKLLLNRPYDGEVSMLLAPITNLPTKGPACLDKCALCAAAAANEKKAAKQSSTVIKQTIDNDSDKLYNNNEHSISSSNKLKPIKKLVHNISLSNIHMKDKSGDNGSVDDVDASHTTKTVNGKFFMVNGANISCACPRSPNGFSKYCHLCDGYIDLILVRHTTFFNNLRFLMAMSGRNCKIADLSHVEIYRAKEFSFRPSGLQTGASTYNLHSSRSPISSQSNDSSHTSVWNCDGEVINDSEVFIKSHRGLINVYRRGLYRSEDDVDGSSEASCCC